MNARSIVVSRAEKNQEFHMAIINSFDYQVAMIDQQGFIIVTNRAWDQFCVDNGGVMARCGTGMNYLDVSHSTTADGIKMVLGGKLDRYTEEYSCDSHKEKRWFTLVVTPFRKPENEKEIAGAVVTHLNITERKVLELAQEKELELARQLQRSVLTLPMKKEGIAIEGVYLPSNKLSGDMYAWYQISKTQFGVILLDIVGHGVSSSLVSMSIRALLEGVIKRAGAPSNVYKELNEHFNQLFGSKVKFCTIIYLLIDTGNRTIQYINAGSPNGIVFGQEILHLDRKTVPIGMMDNPNVYAGQVSYSPGDQIILYTDGVADTLGVKLSECAAIIEDEGQSKLEKVGIEEFMKELLAGANQVDDVTAVAIYL